MNPFFPITEFFVLWCILASAPEHQHEAAPPLRVMQHIAMATEFELILYGAGAETDPESLVEAGRDAMAAVDHLERHISRWRPDSSISLANRRAHEHPVRISGDAFEILLHARRFYDTTNGAFDVTVGPLLGLWGFYGKTGTPPDAAEVKQKCAIVGLKYVQLNADERTVYFERPGMALDFGGIGKGLALDRMAAVLEEHGVRCARLHAGTSTIVAMGAPPGRSGWTVDIRSPYNTEAAHIATVEIVDESLSTSSGSERFVEIEGVRYAHIIDPRTGMPASGVASATAIAPTGVESDALSTAFCVMGVEATRAYCEAHPQVRAILVVERDDSTETIFINFSDDIEKEP